MHIKKWTKLSTLLLMTIYLTACNKPVVEESDSPATATKQQVLTSDQNPDHFKLENIPLSKAPLGVFPFIGIPLGYQAYKPLHSPLENVPFWTGSSIEKVEGKLFGAGIIPLQGQQGSFEVIQKSIETFITSLGGVKLIESQIPLDQIKGLDKDFLYKFYDGIGGIYEYPVHTYVIRQPERTVWVQLTQNNSDSAGLLVSESVVIESKLLIKELFPFIQLPEQYQYREQKTADRVTVPVWNGSAWSLLSGQLFAAGVEAKHKDQGSALEVTRYLEAVMQKLGAQKISETKIASESISPEMKKFMENHYHATAGLYSAPLHVYVLEKENQKIWFQYAAGSQGSIGLWVLAEKEIDANALSAVKLKEQLDQHNKVNIQVNFDTNKALILDSSKKQLDEVTALLKHDPTLKLYIYGHTDNTGQAKQNLTLSNARANAVVEALIAQGIEAERLDAQGFGDQKPVASNLTELGKAQNRRVELVKQL